MTTQTELTKETPPQNEDEDESPPSHNMEGKYVIFMETQGEEHEQWLNFIVLEGNEENLKHLQEQLLSVEWTIEEDGNSTFDLDLDHPVSAITAKEMTKVDLNAYSFNRKFDGKLRQVNLGFKKKDKHLKKLDKAFEVLGYGKIEDYIDDEDVDSEDLTENGDSSEDEDTENESESDSDTEDETDKPPPPPPAPKKEREKGIPKALLESDRPRWTRGKGGKKNRK